MEKGRKK